MVIAIVLPSRTQQQGPRHDACDKAWQQHSEVGLRPSGGLPVSKRNRVHRDKERRQQRPGGQRIHHKGEKGNADDRETASEAALHEGDQEHSGKRKEYRRGLEHEAFFLSRRSSPFGAANRPSLRLYCRNGVPFQRHVSEPSTRPRGRMLTHSRLADLRTHLPNLRCRECRRCTGLVRHGGPADDRIRARPFEA